jgi:choline-glycine betaine transporter
MCCALCLLLWVKVFEGGRLRMAVGHVHSQEKEATRADQSMHIALYMASSSLSALLVAVIVVVVVVVFAVAMSHPDGHALLCIS